jgi:hypothetical protein
MGRGRADGVNRSCRQGHREGHREAESQRCGGDGPNAVMMALHELPLLVGWTLADARQRSTAMDFA